MKVYSVQSSFSGGEIGPELYGRVDLPFYPNCVKSAINAHTVVQGGIVPTPGTEYITEAVNQSNDRTRLFPFVYSTTETYLVEMTDTKLRLYRNGEIVRNIAFPYDPYEITLPSGLAGIGNVSNIVVIPRDNFLIMWRTDGLGIFRFARVADDVSAVIFTLDALSFQVPPLEEVGETRFNTSFTLAATTLTAGAAAFQASDVGRQIKFYDGLLQISAYTSTTVVTVTILSAPSVAVIAAYGDFELLDSPQAKITPSGDITVGGTVTLTTTTAVWKNDAQMTHLGMFVELNGGIVEITGVTSATVATGVARKTLTGTAAAFAGGWRLLQSIVTTVTTLGALTPGKIIDRFKAGCSFEGRLVFGGTARYPNRLVMSVTGQYLNFSTGTDPADGISRDLDGYDQILHLTASHRLYAFTFASEYAITGSDAGPVTPLSMIARSYSAHGSLSTVQPINIGNDTVMVQRVGQRVRGYSYQFAQDDFEAPDYTIRNPTITEAGVVRLVYSDSPYQVMWALLADGTCALMCIDKASSTYAWSRFETDGDVIDIASVPESAGDSIYMCVKRTIDGVVTYFIERADYAYNTHCGIKATAAATDVWAVAHLEDKACDVLADDVPMNQLTVTAGNITLPRDAETIEAGLPFVSTIELLPAEFNMPDGPVFGRKAQLSEVMLRVVRTRGLSVNGEQLVYRELDTQILNEPIAPFTGDKKIPQMGWEDNQPPIVITRNQPLPFHISAVRRSLQVN